MMIKADRADIDQMKRKYNLRIAELGFLGLEVNTFIQTPLR